MRPYRGTDSARIPLLSTPLGRLRRVPLPAAPLLMLLLVSIPSGAQWTPLNPVTAVEKQSDGVVLTQQVGTLRLLVCSDSIIRVLYSPGATVPDHLELVVTKTGWAPTPWTLTSSPEDVTLETAQLKVSVGRKDGAISFSDATGRHLFTDNGRRLTPAEVNGEKTYHAEMWSGLWGSSEAFYGLGQHQAGVWNYRGESVDISQDNTNISVPMFVSSNGYGLFWNNDSRSRFNNRFVHALYVTSEVADDVDYYFLYGPDFDRIISAYRELTGQAPLFGKWAYGFWQCKNRYQSQEELLGVAHKYRDLGIPVDNIVQDWYWWNTMGEPVFNKNYPDPKGMINELHRNNFHVMFSVWPYFDPGSPVYDEMSRLGYFIDRTTVTTSSHPAGMALYDAFNAKARAYYWKLMDQGLFSIGADAWWLDTTEPETEGREDSVLVHNHVAIGSGARYANLYPLMTTTGVYQGQRSVTDRKRVFILSRSAFAGAQRNAVTAWSGDVNSDWVSFKRQIPAGLNFSLSGLPNWTTDIGGFVDGNPDRPAYRELFVRWFEFGAFCPIFRVHGTRQTNQNELWSYGPEAQAMLTRFDKLRYRLLPYIYSLGWVTTKIGYTPMRALAMDFRTDARALNTGDEFMFGPALLVSPVTEPGATSRSVYLPAARWYDFWTGKTAEGGRALEAPAPLDRIPLYVRAGSIVPLGPDLQYAAEKPADPIELRVYRGADASFTLYEDEGDTYDYEKGVYATIPIKWDDARHTLTLGQRQGRFPGMLESRTFRVVLVSEGHGAGISQTPEADRVVLYTGQEVKAGASGAARNSRTGREGLVGPWRLEPQTSTVSSDVSSAIPSSMALPQQRGLPGAFSIATDTRTPRDRDRPAGCKSSTAAGAEQKPPQIFTQPLGLGWILLSASFVVG
ncbi:MAG TPA: glycoside hydrolase family 31 protein [Terriglobia bacterium]|nr:glycoside hydrolase family 31 protein [Terriglobia bacterium]